MARLGGADADVPGGGLKAGTVCGPHGAIQKLEGPFVGSVVGGPTSWLAFVGLAGKVWLRLHESRLGRVELGRGDLALAEPPGGAVLELAAGDIVEIVSAPASPAVALCPGATGLPSRSDRAGRGWLIPRIAVEHAFDLEQKNKIKIAEPVLWRPQAPAGRWQPGTEIECPVLATGYFKGGAPESPHVHSSTFEAYQVIEGSLRLMEGAEGAPQPRSSWVGTVVTEGEVVVLAPGQAHLVDERSEHLSLVLQLPPAAGDKRSVQPPCHTRPDGWCDMAGQLGPPGSSISGGTKK